MHTKSKIFTKTLCSLLTAGFIFGGCNSLNKNESYLPSTEKPAIVQTETSVNETSVKQDSYIPLVSLSKNNEGPNLYFSSNIKVKETTLSGYQKLSLPKQDYMLGNKQPETNSQAREKLYKYFGLDKFMILPNEVDFYKNSFFNARIHLKFLKIEDILSSLSDEGKDLRLGPLKSAELTFNFRF